MLALKQTNTAVSMTVDNTNNHDYSVAYYSSVNGRWVDITSKISHNKINHLEFKNSNPFKPAKYQIVIGEQSLRRSYCSANIEKTRYNKPAHFTTHSGHCETQQTHSGHLNLTLL